MLIDGIAFCFWQDAEARAMAKERQKKDNHNLSEYALFPHFFQFTTPHSLKYTISASALPLTPRHHHLRANLADSALYFGLSLTWTDPAAVALKCNCL